MTREKLKGKQTPGEATVRISDGEEWYFAEEQIAVRVAHDYTCVAGYYPKSSNAIEKAANASLYAEAHNVANRTGMWPEDLVERVKELEEALTGLMDQINPVNYPAKKWDDPANDITTRGIGSRTMPDEHAVLSAYRAILNKKP